MVRLGGDTINFRQTGACWLKQCKSKDLEYSSQFGEWEVYSTFCKPCATPPGWCAGASLDWSRDCDGDGTYDPACANGAGQAGFLSSDDGCADTWPTRGCGERGGGSSFFSKMKSKLEGMGTFGTLVKEAEAEEKKIKSQLAPAEKAMAEVYKGIRSPDYNAPPRLGGNKEWMVNRMVISIVVFIVGSTAVAGFVDVYYSPKALEGRPKLWAMTMLSTSYLLLIPGLTNVLLSFSIIVNVVGHRIRVHPNASEPSCTESTPGLIQLLYDTGGTTGAYLIILFAMVVPAMELFFLSLGELCRFRVSGAFAKCFRMSIIWVQHRSKWASPDMFAYTLLVYLIRNLDHDPLILTAAQLDIGFGCFCAFCVCATVSALGFPLPEVEDEEDEDEGCLEPPQPLVLRLLGRWLVALIATTLAVACAMLLYRGANEAVMAFRINERPLYKPVGPLPTSAKAAVDMLDIPNMLKSDVSLWQCILAMSGWAREGEATSALATVMWGIFVLGFTALDVVLLSLAAWRLCLFGRDGSGPAASLVRDPFQCGQSQCLFMTVAKVVKKLAMLDVAVVGIYLVTYCMAIYKNIGVLVSTREGVLILFIAEVLHNLLYWLVSSAADVPKPKLRPLVLHPYAPTALEDTSMDAELWLGCNQNCLFGGFFGKGFSSIMPAPASRVLA